MEKLPIEEEPILINKKNLIDNDLSKPLFRSRSLFLRNSLKEEDLLEKEQFSSN